MPLSLVDLPAELLHTIAPELHAPDEDRWDIYYRKQENCRKDVVSLSQADSHLRLVCLPFIFETLLLAEEKDQRAKFGFGQTTLVGRLGKIVQTPHIVRCVKHVVIERTNIEEDANILVWASVWKFPMLETIRCVGLSTVFSSPKFLNAVGEHLRLQKVYSDHIPLASPAQYSSNAVLCSAMAKIVFDSTPSTDGGALLLSSTNNTQLLSWLSHGATVESMRFRQQSTAVTWMSSHLSYFEHLRELHLTSVCDATLTPLLLPIMERHPALIVHLDSRNTTAGHPMFLSLVQHSGALQGTELSLEDISVLQDITNSSLWKHGASAPMCLKTIMSRFSDEYVGPALDLLRMLVIALPSLEELNVYMMVMDERDDEALTTLQASEVIRLCSCLPALASFRFNIPVLQRDILQFAYDMARKCNKLHFVALIDAGPGHRRRWCAIERRKEGGQVYRAYCVDSYGEREFYRDVEPCWPPEHDHDPDWLQRSM